MMVPKLFCISAFAIVLPLAPFASEPEHEKVVHKESQADTVHPAKVEHAANPSSATHPEHPASDSDNSRSKAKAHEEQKHGKNPEHESKVGAASAQKSPHGKEKDGDGTAERQAPHPDTVFARAADWNDGQAEILNYAVKRTSLAGELSFDGQMATERLFLRPDGQAMRMRTTLEDKEILNAAMMTAWKEDGVPRSVETVVQMPRSGAFGLVRQEQSLQSWPSNSHRSLDCRVTPPRLTLASSGGEAPMDTTLKQWPVYTEEMLFTYLRALPFRAGYREEVWMFDGGPMGRFSARSQYAAIAVRSKAANIRDMETWYVTVDREDGRRSEFWVSARGLHPIVMAILADRSVWTLSGIARRKYPGW